MDLFVQATNVNAAGAVETYTTGIGRFAALVDGRHAYTLADVRAVIGSKTFALYAGVFANSGQGRRVACSITCRGCWARFG